VLTRPTSGPVERLLDAVARSDGDRFLFVGDALDSLGNTIRDQLGVRAVCVGSGEPRAADVAALAADPLRVIWAGRELEGKTPEYLRGADARKPRQRN